MLEATAVPTKLKPLPITYNCSWGRILFPPDFANIAELKIQAGLELGVLD